ncbi:hypothetical protein Ato02nite_082270 [Paractinoplanes toevensis]|uniref:N-acetyltransferase domain-containing protein n=1 Tax=Paractinoplanes toevensis TaxID=571911 RepID=A0A920BPH1_9ACTN|nr:hypothetical protein Ato02nite_082270 [Actinoplanes toevensis]
MTDAAVAALGVTGQAGVSSAGADVVGPDLIGLAERCLRADGGMPLAVEPWFLRRRWAVPEGVTFGLRQPVDGRLVAAGAVCPSGDGVIVTGLVDPAVRGRGLGARVLDHGLSLAGGKPVTVETESLTEAGAALFASRGLVQTFAEDVMRIGLTGPLPATARPGEVDLAEGPAGSEPADRPGVAQSAAQQGGRELAGRSGVIEHLDRPSAAEFAARRAGFEPAGRPVVAEHAHQPNGVEPGDRRSGVGPAGWPGGVELFEWSGRTAERFHRVYVGAFRDRPGFSGESAASWIAEHDEDDEFRAAWSVLVADSGGDVGFVTAAVGWIVQVGVLPRARGRGLGAALVRESLGRMAAAGGTEAWLNVNVNNPGAAALYRGLGFVDRGRRARFQRAAIELAS